MATTTTRRFSAVVRQQRPEQLAPPWLLDPAPPDPLALVAIDATLPNLPLLLAGLEPGHTPLLIQPEQEPLAQILDALCVAPTAYRSLAIVAHGAAAGIRFAGEHLLSAAHVRAATPLLRSLQLTSIDLWCCSLGRNPELLNALANSSGAVVSASTSPVGHASLGGSWSLDSVVGRAA